MDIVKNIIKIRREKGISQEYIANALGVDTAVISNIENGKRELKVKELEIIAKALEIDVLYLLTYPHVYIKKDLKDSENQPDAIMQIRLTGDKFDFILSPYFQKLPPDQRYTKSVPSPYQIRIFSLFLLSSPI